MSENDIKKQIIVKEYETLKAELRDLVGEMSTIARYAVIGSAAIFAIIIAKDKNHAYDSYLTWLPLIMSALFAFRTYSLYERLQLISKYIEQKIERKIYEDSTEGWETFLNKNIKDTPPFHKSKAQLSTVFFWIVLLIFCLLFPFIYKSN